MPRHPLAVLTCVATILGGSAVDSALALDLVLINVGIPFTEPEAAAVERVEAKIEAAFSDPITVRINIGWSQDLPAGPNVVAGSARVATTTHWYVRTRAMMMLDADSILEEESARDLPFPDLHVRASNSRVGDVRGGTTMTTANAKALGLGTGRDPTYAQPPVGVDGEIRFNVAVRDIFDSGTGPISDPEMRDFEGMVAHEVVHVLGFASQIEVQDNNLDLRIQPSPLDLRMHDPRIESHYPTESRIFRQHNMEYDDGVLTRFPMSYGTDLLDAGCTTDSGRCQAGHWSGSESLLMRPRLSPGERLRLENEDIHALDYLGYDVIAGQGLQNLWEPISFEMSLAKELGVLGSVTGVMREQIERWFNSDGSWPGGEYRAFSLRFESNTLGSTDGVGLLAFREPEAIAAFKPVTDPPVQGFEALSYGGLPPTGVRPLRITEFAFVSDGADVPFVFEARLAVDGADFDTSIGRFGGFRIPGTVNAGGDTFDDAPDARMTLVLEMESSKEGDIGQMIDVRLSTGSKGLSSGAEILDAGAFK